MQIRVFSSIIELYLRQGEIAKCHVSHESSGFNKPLLSLEAYEAVNMGWIVIISGRFIRDMCYRLELGKGSFEETT